MTATPGPDDSGASLTRLFEESAEELYEEAPCGYVSTLPDGVIVRANRTICDWLGYAADELVGRRIVDLMTAGGRIYHETHYAPLLRMQGSVREIAVDLVCADGERLPVLLNSVLRVDDAGEPRVIRTTVFNATDRKTYEQELVRQRRRAEETAVRIGALQQVTAALAASLSVGDIARVLERAAVEELSADSSVLWVVNDAATALVRASGVSGEIAVDAEAAEAETLRTASVARRDEPGGGVLLTIPLVVEEQRLGVASFRFGTNDAVDTEQLGVLETLGRQTAQAMVRARLHEQVVAQTHRLTFMLEASSVLAAATDFTETIERLASIAVPTLGDVCLIDVLDENGQLARVAARHADTTRQSLLEEVRRRYPPTMSGPLPGVRAVVERQSFWQAELSDAFIRTLSHDDEHFRMLKDLGYESFMAVPLVAHERAVGSMTILSAGSGRHFGPEHLRIVEELADRVALVVDKAERYERELQISHTLQARLLPRSLPDVPGLAIAVRYLPGTLDVEVGGDFYDVVPLPGGDVAVVVGDVAGHDVTAAANMGQLRSATRTLAIDVDGPAALLRRLHEVWELLDLDRIATAVFAVLRPSDGRLRVASAGHPPPLFVHGEEAWFAPVEPAAPLGAPVVTVDEWSGELPVGATMLLYTDGLVESRELEFEDGAQRLAAAALDAATADPEVLCDHILDAVAGDQRSDDVALLAITALPR